MRRAIAAAVLSGAVALLAVLGGGVSPAVATTAPVIAPVVAAAGGELSDSGTAAIADLRACLASQSTLNVYYLIDSSTSLRRADDGGPGSDPDAVRAEILGNSLQQLGALSGAEISLNWAAGFFATDYSAAIGWQTYDDDSPRALADTISQKRADGYTNWPAALAGAQQQLAQQQGSAPGCQMLIWLTDGALDIQAPDGQQQEDRDALNAMCGAVVDDRGAAPSGYGVFNSFRQSGVVVVGALLAVGQDAADAAPTMQALVEGGAEGGAVQCGAQPMPDDFVHGAFVNADGPDALSMVFLQLSAQVAGGYPQPFDENGGFWVDEGVSRFRVIVSGEWTLTPPQGSGWAIGSNGAGAEWADIETSGGASVITVAASADDARGQWRLDAADRAGASLFLFSDLRIEFDDVNQIEMADDGSFASDISATVKNASGDPVDLSVFGEAVFSASYFADGTRVVLNDAVSVPETGRIIIGLPDDVSLASIDVSASLDPLRTAEHELVLAPVTTQKTIALTLGAQFPHAVTDPPARLSDLEGADGEATGFITIAGPTEGGDGTACIVADETGIVSDAGDRAEQWRWQFGDLDGNGCVVVPQGGEVRVPVSATNEIPADSNVAATVPVRFIPASGGEGVQQSVPIEFRSTHPVNTSAVVLLAFGLLALGLLVPLVVLWLLNWLTTRIDVPKNTQRAAFPIDIGASEVRVTAPSSGTALANGFVYRQPSEKGERTITDPVLGTLRTRVPWFPLRAPWYEVTAPAGAALITARSGRMTTGSSTPRGALRFTKLSLDRFFGIVVSDNELRRTSRGDSVSGTVVIYHRASPSDPGQYTQRITELTVDSTFAVAVNRAREALFERDRASGSAPKNPGDPGSQKNPPVPAVPAAGERTLPPVPPRTGTTPPPRGAGTTPASTRGPGTPPPPRPGTPPPPRPGTARPGTTRPGTPPSRP